MMANAESVHRIVSSVHLRIEDFLADSFSTKDYPHVGKVVGALALVGIYCFTRNILRQSKSFTKYVIRAKRGKTAKSLPGRYGTNAWAMVLNSTDSLGNAYCHHLSGAGFNLILCGPPVDLDRMEGQASVLKNHYKMRTRVLVVDYHNLSNKVEETYQEIAEQLQDCDICILINNQAYSVPFDYARADLMNQTVESCVAQINKHINCSLLIQQLIVPKMLTRNEEKKLRSAILTLKTNANAIFEQYMAQTLKFPILRSAMAFNSTLTAAMRQQYQSHGIDVMQAFAPFVSFESWLKYGLILEVVMQERLLVAHVRSVLNHLMQGYEESHGSYKEALYRNFHMRYLSPNGAFQACLFERYAEISDDFRSHNLIQNQKEAQEKVQIKAILPSQVQKCDQIVQTQIDLASFRAMISARDVDEDEEDAKFEWTELSEMEEIYEEQSYQFEPVEGEKLEFESKRRIWQAEMSLNKKYLVEANKMSQETLMEMATTGKPVTIASKLAEKMKDQAVVESERPETAIKVQLESLKDSQRTTAESLQNSQSSSSHGQAFLVSDSADQTTAPKIKTLKSVESQKRVDVPLTEGTINVFAQSLSQQADVYAKKQHQAEEQEIQAQRYQAERMQQDQAAQVERDRVHAEEVANQKRLENEEAQRTAKKAAEAAEKERLEAYEAELVARQAAEKAENERHQAEEAENLRKMAAEEVQRLETVAALEKLRIAEENADRVRNEVEEAQRVRNITEATAMKERLESEEAARLQREAEEKAEKERQEAEVAEAETQRQREEEAAKLLEHELVRQEEEKRAAEEAERIRQEAVVAAEVDRIAAAEVQQRLRVAKENDAHVHSAITSFQAQKPIQKHKNTMSFSDPTFVPEIYASQQPEENLNETPVEEKQQVIEEIQNRVQTPQGSDQSSQPTNDETNSGSSRAGMNQTNKLTSSYTPKSMQEAKKDGDNQKKPMLLAPVPKLEEKHQNEITPRKSATPQMKKPETMQANPSFDKLSSIDDKINEPKQDSLNGSPEFTTTKISPRGSQDKNLKEDSDIVYSSSRSPSPNKFIAVKPAFPISKPSIGSPSKSNRDTSGSVVSRNSNEEWKQTPVKEINQVLSVGLIKNMSKMLSEKTQNISPKAASSESSQFEVESDGIQISARSLKRDLSTLSPSISERQFEESSGSNEENQAIKNLPQERVINYEKFAAPNSGRVKSGSDPILSNRENNLSSSSDMRELKLALGDKSDRSGNGTAQDQKASMLEIDGEIFSDEAGSSDASFDLEKYEDEQDNLWQKAAEEAKKASLQFCRGITKRLKKGDDVDQAIGSVLSNFISNVLTHDSNAVENDQNLTQIQKLEKKNLHIINELATCLPYVKLSPGRYLIGTEIRSVQIKGRGVLVRTGGGYMYLNEFCLHYAKSECLKMALLMMKTHSNYKTCVVSLLKKHQNTTTAQKDFIRKCPPEIDQQFNEIVEKVRNLELSIKQIKSRKSFNAPQVSKEDALNMSMHSSESKKTRKTLFTPGVTKLLIYKSPSPTPGQRVPISAKSPGRTYPNTLKHTQRVPESARSPGRSQNMSMQLSEKKSLNTSSLIEKELIKAKKKEKALNNSMNSGPVLSRFQMSNAISSSLFPPMKSKMIKKQQSSPNKDIQTQLATPVFAGRSKVNIPLKPSRPDALASSPAKKLYKSSTAEELASPARLQRSTAKPSPKK